MAATGKHLKVKKFGENTLGIDLEGNPNKPEPDNFAVKFRGGEVQIVRTEDNDYWIHVIAYSSDSSNGERCDNREIGAITDSRVNVLPRSEGGMISHIAVKVSTKQIGFLSPESLENPEMLLMQLEGLKNDLRINN